MQEDGRGRKQNKQDGSQSEVKAGGAQGSDLYVFRIPVTETGVNISVGAQTSSLPLASTQT